MKDLAIVLDNRPGALAEMGEALKQAVPGQLGMLARRMEMQE